MVGKRLRLLFCAAGILAAASMSAQGDTMAPGARSASSVILGAEGWTCGALPPPGFYLLNYSLYYYAHQIKGQDSGEVDGAPFRDFKASASASVFRPVYVSEKTLFGANLAWHAVIPLVHKNQESDVFDDTMDGVGDITISPLILSWHKPPFHWAAGMDVVTPTGHYSSTDLTTIGNNHWTFEPVFAISYLGENGLMADLKLMYDFHTRDSALDYREGQQFHLDYNVGVALGQDKALKVGVAGYYLTSTENDSGPAGTLPDSKENVFALGPSVMYCKGKWSVEAKVLFETDAQNRPEGTASWLKIVYSF